MGLNSGEDRMLSERAKALTGSLTSGMRNRARKLKAQGVQVVNFAAGELDQDTSPNIKEAARKSIDAGRTQYTDTLGVGELREILAQRISRKTGVAYAAEELGFTAGAKQALFSAALAVFGPGDEVIIPAPYWVTFPEQVRLAGATPVFLDTESAGFQVDSDALVRLITQRTRGILLNTPHNPTGVVYSAKALQKIAEIILQHGLTCVYDECYDELVYAPAEHQNIVKLVPEMKERTILVGSLSKTYCMAGWRAGYFAAPKAVVKAIANLQSHSASNPCNIVQYAALSALSPANDGFVEGIRGQLRNQRAIALELIAGIPLLTCTVPQGAFYLFPNISNLLGKSFNGTCLENVDILAEMLLEHAHIAVVPGSAFGAPAHVRISYAIPGEAITTGLTSLKRFVQSLA
jgi:aspartate aminotransferase